MRLPLTHRPAVRQPDARGLALINPPGGQAFPVGPAPVVRVIRGPPLPGYRGRARVMRVDTFRSTRMLAERPGPEDFPEWCQFRQDPRVAATLGGPRPEERLRRELDRTAH